MAQDNSYQGEIDPEIEAMLKNIGNTDSPSDAAAPNYSDIFADEAGGAEGEADAGSPIDSAGFPEITKRFENFSHNAFEEPEYYKTVLANEGDKAQRIHGILQKLLGTKDPKDKGVFRQQFIPAFWDFLAGVAQKAPGKLPASKKYLLRFGVLHPTMLKEDTRELFGKIIVENDLDQPVYYVDEWYKAVGTGTIRNSSTDEVNTGKSNVSAKLKQLFEKANGKLDGAKNLLKAKSEERLMLEKNLNDCYRVILERFPAHGLTDINVCYSDAQKRTFSDIQEILKALLRTDHDLEIFFRDYHVAEGDLSVLKSKIEADGGDVEVDTGAVDTEFNTVRQMVKMTIGRQGNHFPLLTSEYFRSMPNEIGTRENVISILAWIESIDPEAFCRLYKNRSNRIVPYVVLLPTYGDYGMCWEPFDRYNRATSRGRIAVPMYPKNLHLAVLYAVGDLRWQVAKEKASFYWMEEGITGNYYQWFQKMKLKGDLKETFIEDYITWMTKESEGTMKLDKELRGTFWRYMPFSQPVKEKLKTRSFTYQELYQRDVNRSMSDGY
ncbi:MAG: hypothetical protein LBH43_00250 [Treponema sp.]|jgi:hypothetical protein|nr:hypothetical protein [Treponema sp.]